MEESLKTTCQLPRAREAFGQSLGTSTSFPASGSAVVVIGKKGGGRLHQVCLEGIASGAQNVKAPPQIYH